MVRSAPHSPSPSSPSKELKFPFGIVMGASAHPEDATRPHMPSRNVLNSIFDALSFQLVLGSMALT